MLGAIVVKCAAVFDSQDEPMRPAKLNVNIDVLVPSYIALNRLKLTFDVNN